MRKEYEEKLQLMKDEMEKAEVFAEKLPFFSTLILDNIITGNEPCLNFCCKYKGNELPSNVIRRYYTNDTFEMQNGSGVLRMGGRRNPFVNQAVWRKSIDAELGNGIAYGRILQ